MLAACRWDIRQEDEKLWFSFKDAQNIDDWVTASDSDFGGQSIASLELTGNGTVRFWGDLFVGRTTPSDEVAAEQQMRRHSFKAWAMRWWKTDKMKVARSGFAAFACKPHTLRSNIDDWNVLRLRLRPAPRVEAS